MIGHCTPQNLSEVLQTKKQKNLKTYLSYINQKNLKKISFFLGQKITIYTK